MKKKVVADAGVLAMSGYKHFFFLNTFLERGTPASFFAFFFVSVLISKILAFHLAFQPLGTLGYFHNSS